MKDIYHIKSIGAIGGGLEGLSPLKNLQQNKKILCVYSEIKDNTPVNAIVRNTRSGR